MYHIDLYGRVSPDRCVCVVCGEMCGGVWGRIGGRFFGEELNVHCAAKKCCVCVVCGKEMLCVFYLKTRGFILSLSIPAALLDRPFFRSLPVVCNISQ
jgi:hypothetical protein